MAYHIDYPDIRVVRTKYNLRNALIDLLQNDSYKSINVTEIARKAGVNRVTFYNHYYSKDDLMEEVLDLLLEEYESLIERIDTKKLNSGSPMEIEHVIEVYYSHYNQYAKVYKILLSKEFPNYKEKFMTVLQNSIHSILSNIKRNPQIEEEDYVFIIEWFVGGTIQTIHNYINSEKKFSAEILTKRMIKMTVFMLQE